MPAASPTRGRIHALIVEDNADHAIFLERLLGGSSHPEVVVSAASSLADGLEKLEAGDLDIVLLDLSLPDSDGLETFDRIHAAAGPVPVVVLSGIADVSVAIHALQRGAQDYLVKGHVDNHLLQRSVQYAIERKSAQLALKRANEELENRVRERTSELMRLNDRLKSEVTERRRAEEQTLESNQQLVAALDELRGMQRDLVRRERFQALAHMAKGIAHEFNNVLTPIVGFAEHLLADAAVRDAPQRIRDELQKIKTAALAGSKAVARVRDFARAETGELGPVNVAELVENAVMSTEPRWHDEALASGITISIAQRVPNIPDVQGDPAQLQEALKHLIFNATAAIVRRGVIEVGAERRDDTVALFVEDDGSGMTELQRAHCLDPKANAAALDRRLSGYSVIHNIIARHHGRVEIDSKPGGGTQVSLILPAPNWIPAPSVPMAQLRAATPENLWSVPGLRVLVVDDEPLVREVVKLYLCGDGHVVDTAEDGGTALRKFGQARYDLVLTDRAMPELSGDQLAAEVKAMRPDVPVVLLTGFGDLMNAEGEKPAGVDAVVPKPFTMASLRQVVAEVTKRSSGAPA